MNDPERNRLEQELKESEERTASRDRSIERITRERDRLAQELTEAKAATSGLPAAIETLRLERDRLLQVTGKLVEALTAAKERLRLKATDPVMEQIDAALAKAQKER